MSSTSLGAAIQPVPEESNRETYEQPATEASTDLETLDASPNEVGAEAEADLGSTLPDVSNMTLPELALELQTSGDKVAEIKDEIVKVTTRLKNDLAREKLYMNRLNIQMKKKMTAMNAGSSSPDLEDYVPRKNTRHISEDSDRRREVNPIRNLQLSVYRTLHWGWKNNQDFQETLDRAMKICTRNAVESYKYPEIPQEILEYINMNAKRIYSGEKPIRMTSIASQTQSA